VGLVGLFGGPPGSRTRHLGIKSACQSLARSCRVMHWIAIWLLRHGLRRTINDPLQHAATHVGPSVGRELGRTCPVVAEHPSSRRRYKRIRDCGLEFRRNGRGLDDSELRTRPSG
jgi:hypothetical protein